MGARGLFKSSIGVTIVMLLGYLVSFVKEATIASYFGISNYVDAYNIAIQIPVLLFSFISVAVQSVVVPIYSDIYYKKGPQEGNRYIDALVSLLVLISLLLVIIGEIGSGFIVKAFAPGFNSETHLISVELLRITFPSIIFSIVSQVLVALLNVHKKYVLPSFSVYILNIVLIVSVVLLHTKWGIFSACIGQLVGEIIKWLFLAILTSRLYKYNFRFDLNDSAVNQTLKMALPVFWSISIAEINAVVNRIVGSFLVVGSISALSYAGKINSVLMSLFVSAIATIVYPLYAESAAKNNTEQLNKRVNLTISAYSFFVVPLMFGVFVFKKELIIIAFARGSFDDSAINITKELLGLYAIGILFMSIRSTITNVFYSIKDTKTPAVNATIGAVINVVLNIILPYYLGTHGLALASSLTAIYITVNLMRLLVKKNKEIDLTFFISNLKRVTMSAIIMFFAIGVYYIFCGQYLLPILNLFVGALIGTISYTIFTIVFRTPIVFTLYKYIKK